MKLTKEIVDQLLSINTRNRKYSHPRIEAIARSMKEGNFIPNNGQSIVVNESWNWLLDGQHRLLAIAMAGYPVYDIDVKTVPDSIAEAVFRTIDINHGSRTSGQIIGLSRELKNVNLMCAMTRAISKFAWKESDLSVDELDRNLTLIKDDLDFMADHRIVCSKSVKSSYMAGVINAMMIGDRCKVRSLWLSVCEQTIEKDNASLRSLIPYLVGAVNEPQGSQFFRAIKAMLFPQMKKLVVSGFDELMSKCPYEQKCLDMTVLRRSKTKSDEVSYVQRIVYEDRIRSQEDRGRNGHSRSGSLY